MMTWQCDPPHLYFNLTSRMCQTLCGGFFVEDEATHRCVPCQNASCYQCNATNTSECLDCASYLHFELLPSGECACMSGFFHASSCYPCDGASPGCLNCTYGGSLPFDSTQFTCFECNETDNFFLSAGLCTRCNLSDCALCLNLTACSVCESGFNLSAIGTCIRCNVSGCLFCSLGNASSCLTCSVSLGYEEIPVNQLCRAICGDGIYINAD